MRLTLTPYQRELQVAYRKAYDAEKALHLSGDTYSRQYAEAVARTRKAYDAYLRALPSRRTYA